DFCVVDGKHFFVRCNVVIPLIDRPGETFAWGVWGSLSEESFERVRELWDDPKQESEPPRFSWLSTHLPCYGVATAPVKAWMYLKDGSLPRLEVDREHPLGQEQERGMTMERVWEIARAILGEDVGPETGPERHLGCGR